MGRSADDSSCFAAVRYVELLLAARHRFVFVENEDVSNVCRLEHYLPPMHPLQARRHVGSMMHSTCKEGVRLRVWHQVLTVDRTY